jgi:putative transposase
MKQRKQMVDSSTADLSISSQCRLLSINRSSFYYRTKPVKADDLDMMRLIDKQYLKTPTWGSRSMRSHLRRLGYRINRTFWGRGLFGDVYWIIGLQ